MVTLKNIKTREIYKKNISFIKPVQRTQNKYSSLSVNGHHTNSFQCEAANTIDNTRGVVYPDV